MSIKQAMLGGFGLPCDSATFTGSDHLLKGSVLTGIVDGKQGIFSGWVRLDVADGTQLVLFCGGTTAPLFRIAIVREPVGNKFQIVGFNAAGGGILQLDSVNAYLQGATWRHVLCSWDLATVGARHLYINSVSDLAVTTFSNDTIDYDMATPAYAVNAQPDGANDVATTFAEFFFHTSYLDLSIESNRTKFIAANRPVYLGATGQLPLGLQPLMYLRVAKGAAASTFATNLGSGGNFTITGSLTTGSTSPST